jgi:hypothetical protein
MERKRQDGMNRIGICGNNAADCLNVFRASSELARSVTSSQINRSEGAPVKQNGEGAPRLV